MHVTSIHGEQRLAPASCTYIPGIPHLQNLGTETIMPEQSVDALKAHVSRVNYEFPNFHPFIILFISVSTYMLI